MEGNQWGNQERSISGAIREVISKAIREVIRGGTLIRSRDRREQRYTLARGAVVKEPLVEQCEQSVEDGGVGFEYLMRGAIRRDEGHT